MSISDGADGSLRELIENDAIDQWIRSAALDAMVEQVAAGQRSREEAMGYFKGLFRTLDRRNPSYVWTSLANNCADLCPEEVQEELGDAYRNGLIEPDSIHPEDVREAIAMGKEKALEQLRGPRHGPIDDLERDMSWMAAFEHEEIDPIAPAIPALDPYSLSLGPMGGLDAPEDDESIEPFVRPEPKVGRNDPCICGSGKKYKKCCGS